MKRLLTLPILTLLCLPLFAGKTSRDIKPYDFNTPRMGAIVYALPKTIIQVEVTAACTISKPGPFAQYAGRYLASDDAITSCSRVWTFESADIREKFVVDSSRFYAVCGESQELAFADGKPFLRSVGSWNVEDNDLSPLSSPEPVDTVFHTELLGEEALTSTSIPKMAERAAKQIFLLREARMAILTCDVNHQPDGSATKEILARIDRDERELTALFIGKRTVVHSSRIFAINPAENKNNLIIARVSTIEGIASADDMIGTPVYVSVKTKTVSSPADDKKSQKGYFYIVPGSAKISVRHGDSFSLTRYIDIPQNGYATWLDPSVSNILFNENGTILKVK